MVKIWFLILLEICIFIERKVAKPLRNYVDKLDWDYIDTHSDGLYTWYHETPYYEFKRRLKKRFKK